MASNKQSKLANKYSKALLSAFLTGVKKNSTDSAASLSLSDSEKKELQKNANNLIEIASAVDSNIDTLSFFLSPTISISSKEKVIISVLDSVKADALLTSFIKAVLKNGRIDCLSSIANAFSEEVRGALSVLAVKVTTAREVSGGEREDIAKIVSAKSTKELQFSWHVNPSLLGGIVLEYDGRRYDSTILGRLESLQSQVKF